MTAGARGGLRPIVLSAVAGLAIGVAVFAFSRGGSTPTAHGSGASLLPSALPSASAGATAGSSSLPPESVAEQDGRYYAVFVAVAQVANDPQIVTAQQRAKALGYQGGIAELGCTAGAREQLGLPERGTYT